MDSRRREEESRHSGFFQVSPKEDRNSSFVDDTSEGSVETQKLKDKTQYDLQQGDYSSLIDLALKEDHVYDDVTTKSIFSNETALAEIISKERCVVAGIEVADATFKVIDSHLDLKYFCQDGEELAKNNTLMSIQGNVHSILSVERTALNFLSIMSGIATRSRCISQRLSKWDIKLVDTRKTIPGFRALSKYAVSVGGGENHRFHLGNQGLIKDNHIAIYGDLRNAVLIFKKKHPKLFCQVEVDNIYQLEQALIASPDGILLDNMRASMIKRCVKRIKKYSKKKGLKIQIEASGGYHAKNIKMLRNTGIDRVSMSSITMDARPTNFSLEVIQ